MALDRVTDVVVGVAPDTTWALEWLEVFQAPMAGQRGPMDTSQRFYAPQCFANPPAGNAVAAGRLVATVKEQCGYRVVVQTADVRSAGTDAGTPRLGAIHSLALFIRSCKNCINPSTCEDLRTACCVAELS